MTPDPQWPEPRLAPPVLHIPQPDLTHKEIPVQKQDAIDFLRAQLTEERSDKAIQFLGDKAKLVLPDIPVEIAERVLDFLVPERLLDALDAVIDG